MLDLPVTIVAEAAGHENMSTELNKAVVRRYLDQVWNKGNVEASAAFLAAGYRRHVGPS